jgi:hypothetical protein
MALKADTSLIVGLATAALAFGIYQINLPTTAAVRASEPNNQHVDSSRKMATWEAAAAVAGVSLLAHDPTVFVIGGAVVVFLDFSHRAANSTDNVTGKIAGTVSNTGISAQASVGSA